MPKFFDGDGKAALTRAVTAFEAGTAAEIVISVRPRSDTYPRAGILVGTLGALLTTAFLLYSGPEFDLWWFLLWPAAVGLVLGHAANVRALQWLLTSATAREKRVLEAARAVFVERGIADTRGRTGVLLYVSVAERIAVVISDRGVRQAVPASEWDPAVAAITGAVARGATALVLVAPITALAAVAREYLPRAADDINELADAVHT